MLTNILIINFIFLRGLIVFCIQRKHFLILLLRLEFLVVVVYFFFNYYFRIISGNEYFFLMIFLTIGVCEGALGLRILVSLIRSFGNDYIIRFFLLW